MSTAALALREAIYTRLEGRTKFKTRARTPLVQVQPEDLPQLRVVIAGEDMQADGDGNAGELIFTTDVTISVMILGSRNEVAPAEYDADLEMNLIEQLLLTDPTFTRMGPGSLFEAIPRIRRSRIFPREGEAYFVGIRTDFTFKSRADFAPVIPDDFEGIDMTVRPFEHEDAPSITVKIDVPTT